MSNQYPQQQGGYPPQQGGHPPQQGSYPPPQHGYPPQQGGYPPQQGGYPPQQGGYPPQQGGYPPQQGGYPPQHGFPGGYPPQHGGYPPQQVGYPPQQVGYPPQQGGYPPHQGGYPPQQGSYAPQQHGQAPPQGGHQPQSLGGQAPSPSPAAPAAGAPPAHAGLPAHHAGAGAAQSAAAPSGGGRPAVHHYAPPTAGIAQGKTCPIEASNIANLGTELEKKIKLAAAQTEQAWRGVGQRPGLQIWRIEKFTVQAWPEKDYGRFYNGDSYILLHTYQKERALGWDIHFWLGKHTTQDESGTAAYKTVELDDILGGAAVQHREVQEHESSLFLSYFPERTIEIMEGGIESGFNHVEPTVYRPRLLHLKGSGSRIRVSEVPLSHRSLNSGDVFILDAGMKIFQWNGRRANFHEKVKGGNMVRALRDERGAKPLASIHSEGDNDLGEFWGLLGGEGPVMSAQEGGSDAQAAAEAVEGQKLLRLTDASGQMQLIVEQSGELSRRRLDTNDVFVVDSGSEIFVWIGRRASKGERKHGMQWAQKYLSDYSRPNYLPISRVVEGGENDVFEMCFVDGNYSGMRDIGDDVEFRHPCCPHYPAGSTRFASHQEAPKVKQGEGAKVAELFAFFGGGVKKYFS